MNSISSKLGNQEDFLELKAVIGEFLSPQFIIIREAYLIELEKILSKDFSEKIIKKKFK